jgi:hypothetical protein
MADSKLYGPCRKSVNGAPPDGCGEFVADDGKPNFCEACECHKSFHKVLDLAQVMEVAPQAPPVPAQTGSSLQGGEGSFQSPIASKPVAVVELGRRSPRINSAKRVLNVSDGSPVPAGQSNASSLPKKVKVEPGTSARPEHNPYAPALADLQKEFKQEGAGRFEFRKEGGEWQIWCCLCKNLNKVGPGPRKLGNFKKHFASKKHLEMLRTEEEDASVKELAAAAKVKERREREEDWLSKWAMEGGLSHRLFSLFSRRVW